MFIRLLRLVNPWLSAWRPSCSFETAIERHYRPLACTTCLCLRRPGCGAMVYFSAVHSSTMSRMVSATHTTAVNAATSIRPSPCRRR